MKQMNPGKKKDQMASWVDGQSNRLMDEVGG